MILKEALKMEDQRHEKIMRHETGYSVEDLINLLRTATGAQRSEVVETLSCVGEQAVVPLLELLHDEDSNVRQIAATILGRIGDARAVYPLVDMLQNDRFDDARSVAARALGEIGDRSAIKPLSEAALSAAYYDTRVAAIYALIEFKSADVVQPILRTLEDTNDYVPFSAIQALIQLDKSYLDRFKTERIEGVVNGYINRLQTGDKNGRMRATYLLGRVGGLSSVGRLVDILNNDPSDDVRGSAATEIGSIGIRGDESAINSLNAALSSTSASLRWQAAYALGQIGDRDSVPLLETLLVDEDSVVRTEAGRAIKRLTTELRSFIS